jgi:hypothetical protein
MGDDHANIINIFSDGLFDWAGRYDQTYELSLASSIWPRCQQIIQYEMIYGGTPMTAGYPPMRNHGEHSGIR